MTRRIGLVGCGYWGKNLARCFNELGVLKALYDIDTDKARALPITPPVPCVWKSFDEFLENVDAVAIATPPETHYAIAWQALGAKKNIFIEKPMVTKYVQAIHLADLAREKGLDLMVGHIYLHNGGIKLMPVPVGRAELYVQLLNEKGGPSESTRDVIWAGLPHACSLALHFFPDMPEWIEATREEERIKVELGYWNNSMAYLDVGDNTGRKLRRVELNRGTSRYLFDVQTPNLCFLQSGVEVKSFGVDMGPEPLMEECKAFVEYKGVDPLGPKVVRLIEEIINECKSKGT